MPVISRPPTTRRHARWPVPIATRKGTCVRARRLLARSLLQLGRVDEAARVADEAMRVAQAARTQTEVALCELALSEVARTQGDFLSAMRHATRARGVAARAKDPLVLRAVLADFGLMLAGLGDGERANEALGEALAIDATGELPLRTFRVFYNYARVHTAAGRYAAALEMLNHAEAHARATGLVAVSWLIVAARASACIDMGAINRAGEILEAQPLHDDAPPPIRGHLALLRAMHAHAAQGRGPRSSSNT